MIRHDTIPTAVASDLIRPKVLGQSYCTGKALSGEAKAKNLGIWAKTKAEKPRPKGVIVAPDPTRPDPTRLDRPVGSDRIGSPRTL